MGSMETVLIGQKGNNKKDIHVDSKKKLAYIATKLETNAMFRPVDNCPGGRLNKKDGLTRYGDSHVKDKTS